MTFEALKETFTAKGQAQYIDYLNNITRRGYWTLSTNHLAPNNPALRFGVPGKSAYSIQDAVLMQDYPPPIGANGKSCRHPYLSYDPAIVPPNPSTPRFVEV